MRLLRLTAVAGLLLAVACANDPVAPNPLTIHQSANKVDVCHVDGSNNFRLISVADPALPTHIGHGDAQPGDPVPAQPGKKFTATCAIVASGPDFIAFYIRNNGSSITAPWDADMSIVENVAGDGFDAATPRAGQKVGYGTSFFDGTPIRDLGSVNWDKLSGAVGIVAYLNVWVTDGNGHYAVIASENDYRGTDFATRQEWKVFEYFDANGAAAGGLDWLFDSGTGDRDGAQYLTRNGVRVTLADLGANIVMDDPGAPYPAYVGTGAPRGGYGLNLIFGDTQANFIGSYSLENVLVTVSGTGYPASNP